MTRPVLLIGGVDYSGGAGIARDLLAVHDAGQTARIAVTVVTAQTDRRVLTVEPVSPDMLAAQIETALEDGIGAIKIGVLCNATLIRVVAAHLPDVPIVLDPVLCSSSGDVLLEPEGVQVLIELLLPRTTVLTPNVPELTALKSAFCSPRYPVDLRGTGCQLASSIASALACGKRLPEAITAARCSLEGRFRRAQDGLLFL